MDLINALENNDLVGLKNVPKSDLHNHSLLGGSREVVNNLFGTYIQPISNKMQSIGEMNQWIQENVKPLIATFDGFERILGTCFIQAKADGITKLEANIDLSFADYYHGNIDVLVDSLKRIHKTFGEGITFLPEIGFSRCLDPKETIKTLQAYIESGYFKSIDLYDDELSRPINEFKDIYKLAKKSGLKCKAHVGEFGDADSIREAIDVLELDAVQHGIAAVDSKSVMTYIRDNKIQLNICPTSNVMLSRVSDIKEHPIRKLYDFGIDVTINSDDVLIFGSTVSNEYMTLYNSGVFSPMELESIRKTGLR